MVSVEPLDADCLLESILSEDGSPRTAKGAQNSIMQGLKHGAVVRSMPNTPAQVAEGMTVWTASSEVKPAQRDQAQGILRAFGKELFVADEVFLDMATAISGSGPSYVFLFMEALIDAAVHLGFSREDARMLVTQTVRGSAIYAEQSSSHPAEMRNLVTRCISWKKVDSARSCLRRCGRRSSGACRWRR